MIKYSYLSVLVICLWSIHLRAQTTTVNGELKAFQKDTAKDHLNENTINHLSFLLNTQHYRFSPKEIYSIRSERKGYRLDMTLRYPDSVVSYKMNIPQLFDVTTLRDTIDGIEGHRFQIKMTDSVITEYSGPEIRQIITNKLSFFITGKQTSQRLQNILQSICRDNHRRWYLEDERKKETTNCPPNLHTN